jgi:hypothetical protein
MIPFAIPGFEPPSSPKEAARILTQDGTIRHIIHTIAGDAPDPQISLRIATTDGRTIFEDLVGAFVFRRIEHNRRAYELITTAEQAVPPGASFLQVFIKPIGGRVYSYKRPIWNAGKNFDHNLMVKNCLRR